LSFDLAGLGLKEADRTELTAAVQTTRAIIAEYA
jgi:type IV secretion system protein VirD4